MKLLTIKPVSVERALAVFFCVVCTWCAEAQPSGSKLTVEVLDVGQADAILITCPDGNHRLLIDSGDTRYPGSSASFKTNIFRALQDKPQRINVVVASHPHQDHIGNMQWLLEHFEVQTYVDNGDHGETVTFGKLDALRRKLVKAGKLTYISGKQNSFAKIDFCPSVEMELIEPWAVSDLSDINDRSVGVRLKYENSSFLFVGDMHDEAEAVMLDKFTEAQRRDLDVDVLKVGHHGSDTSSSVRFINAVSPEIAVISCGQKEVGTNQGYKHPRLSTLRSFGDWFKNHPPPVQAAKDQIWAYDAGLKKWQLQSRPDGIWLTTKDGMVTVLTDGQKLEVTKEKP